MEKEGAYLIGPVRGDAEQLASEFGVIRNRNQKCKTPVFHMSISIAPSEHLTDRQWVAVARKMMFRLGYRRNHYVIVRHTDEPQDHIHIIASRVRSDNYQIVDTHQELYRASAIASDLEAEYGLIRAALNIYQNNHQNHRESPKKSEKAMQEARQVLSFKTLLRQRIDAAKAGRPTVTEFLARLKRFGVGVLPNIGGNHVSGMSFEMHGFVTKGSKLGRRYTWARLIEDVDFKPMRDMDALRNAKAELNRDPDDLDPLIKQELRNSIIKSNLAARVFSRNTERSSKGVPFTERGAKNPRNKRDFANLLASLGRYARKIENPPFHHQKQEEEDRDNTKRRDIA